MTEEVHITQLVHGGQGLGTLSDGRKVFVWGALPGETVQVRILKQKKSYAEAIVEAVIQASPVRQEPREPNYLATSPWQILPLTAENEYKKRIISELFTQAHVSLPAFELHSAGPEWHYRNKMEYSFWGDDDGLHLALHNRGSHRKTIVEGSALALPAVDEAANAVLQALRALDIRAGDLKTVVVRCNQAGAAVASLFVKPQNFPELPLPDGVQGLRIYHSNPKSPASVPTRLLHESGHVELEDTLQALSLRYDGDSFFQVNLPIFEVALQDIRRELGAPNHLVDMYAGVGGIGLTVAPGTVELVELDPATAAMARINAAPRRDTVTVIEASTEKALEHIVADKPVIFDPPRAGLHDRVVSRVLEVRPPVIIYLSCNPATQARDLAALQSAYEICFFAGYNFFPHTPHIETLAVLKLP